MNGPSREDDNCEEAEHIEDALRAHFLSDGRIDARELPLLRLVRGHVTRLDRYRADKQIIRTLDRRGFDSKWAARQLAERQRGGTLISWPADEPQTAA